MMATAHARSDGEGDARVEESDKGENRIMDVTLNLKTIMLVMIYDTERYPGSPDGDGRKDVSQGK